MHFIKMFHWSSKKTSFVYYWLFTAYLCSQNRIKRKKDHLSAGKTVRRWSLMRYQQFVILWLFLSFWMLWCPCRPRLQPWWWPLPRSGRRASRNIFPSGCSPLRQRLRRTAAHTLRCFQAWSPSLWLSWPPCWTVYSCHSIRFLPERPRWADHPDRCFLRIA